MNYQEMVRQHIQLNADLTIGALQVSQDEAKQFGVMQVNEHDRIVGFELSPVVWKKVPGGKSAGRVQSPAVRLLVEREREIEAFEGSFEFKVVAP